MQHTTSPIEQYVIDKVLCAGKGTAGSATICIRPDRSMWVAEDVAGAAASNRVLHVDKNTVVEAVYKYASAGTAPVISATSIVTLDAGTGAKTGEAALTGEATQCIYPVNAVVRGGKISVLSQYTRQDKKYGRVKYGACIHTLDLAGSAVTGSAFNEFTTTLLKDSVLPGKQLMTRSYLHITHAAPLSNGHWMLAMQQFSWRPDKFGGIIRKRPVSYDLKSSVFADLTPEGTVAAGYVEPNKTNQVVLAHSFWTNPQAAPTSTPLLLPT